MRVEDRGGDEYDGAGRSEEAGLISGALSLSEEQTESQLQRRDEESLENSALSCHRSLQENTHKKMLKHQTDL